MVWGYNQAELEEESKRVLAYVTKSAISYLECASFGLSPFPVIFHRYTDSKVGGVGGPKSDDTVRIICNIAFADIKISSKINEGHVRQVNLAIVEAEPCGAEYAAKQCNWAGPEVEYWGFPL